MERTGRIFRCHTESNDHTRRSGKLRNLHSDRDHRCGLYSCGHHNGYRERVANAHSIQHRAVLRRSNDPAELIRRHRLFLGGTSCLQQCDTKSDHSVIYDRYVGNIYRNGDCDRRMYSHCHHYRDRESTTHAHRLQHRAILRGNDHSAQLHRRYRLFLDRAEHIQQRHAEPGYYTRCRSKFRNVHRDRDRCQQLLGYRHYYSYRESAASACRFQHRAILRRSNHSA